MDIGKHYIALSDVDDIIQRGDKIRKTRDGHILVNGRTWIAAVDVKDVATQIDRQYYLRRLDRLGSITALVDSMVGR
jgi:hypothetical protein